MIPYVVVDAGTRRVLRYGFCMEGDFEHQPVGEGEAILAVAVDGFDFTVAEDGTVEPFDVGPVYPAAYEVDEERDRRIDAGFPFMDKVIQSKAGDRENIAGARAAAQDAIILSAQAGDYGWQKLLDPNGADVFAWITMDNSMLPLDAFQVVQMGYVAMLHKQNLIFTAKAIKDRIAGGEIIMDVTADALWQQ